MSANEIFFLRFVAFTFSINLPTVEVNLTIERPKFTRSFALKFLTKNYEMIQRLEKLFQLMLKLLCLS